jgi:hypothetical protein
LFVAIHVGECPDRDEDLAAEEATSREARMKKECFRAVFILSALLAATGCGASTVWVDDALPAGATPAADSGDSWELDEQQSDPIPGGARPSMDDCGRHR